MHDIRVPVLVVGAGLAGASTACFLAARGVPALVVERRAGASPHPRAIGQNARTMELLRWVGLEEAVHEASPVMDGRLRIVVAQSVHGPVLHSIVEGTTPDTSHLSPASWGLAGQERMEALLLRRAGELGATVRFHTELVEFAQDEDGVTAVLRDRATGEEERVRADYLVGADGNRSQVRERLGVGTHGAGTLTYNISTLFEADLGQIADPGEQVLYYLQHPEFIAALATPAGDRGRHVFSVEYHPDRGESPEDFTEERLTELLRVAMDSPTLRPRFLSHGPWEMAARVADRFRVGRVLLAGDAAKVTPPTGGLGGNTAVQDGFDLAWKLAAVLDGVAGPGLLDSYDAERRPFAEMVVGQSLRNAAFRMAPHLLDGQLPEEIDPVDMVLGFRYRSSAVLAEPGEDDGAPVESASKPSGRPGFRAPHVALSRSGETVSTVDLFGTDWVLLTGHAGGLWHEAARHVADRLRVPLRAVGLDGQLTDPEDRLVEAYGIGDGGASLVRPDGVVAWRSAVEVPDPTATLHRVICQLLDRAE
ncbi:2-polyprenyl-6-methoxyphenol hydroxylase [Streptoalloteichus tenebrarius]|uniref:2-polyprenyl-6-methoxyphenol hydroxylase n=1 Tax=Streptoalloteichus tenebrarius (strain ATCC 17920 / DSM 40477 / JCM 4838 / CBS 697.72 / NBRC 16177 / NCIMB 11028 / NRRL B-12390 / A12253. 1 / ISP 5477) TaxID=1933 RepID=A0ABT1HTA4_STRSD|nr:FAD-dependent monooxygenase [Streptoalloteichus tenebrarius]MCP2258748.1 2-polyprenyl-6-methoxyphenol hydroxylase [Streptoalloteichus tenebrarius]BFF02902.1 FAD-dependent monooxygenase [Streptoalloteichus tenebrarius]